MMRKNLFRKQWTQYIGLALLLIVGQACTDLEPSFSDSTPTEDSSGNFSGVSNAQSSLDGLYSGAQGLGNQADAYSMMEVTAENIAVLTRGADWGDNGVWRIMHNHSWNSAHLHVLNAWNNRNQQILNATRLLDPASGASGEITAQAQVLRAINMSIILNFYGIVPFRGVNDGPDVNPEVLDAQAGFDFVLNDLNSAISSGNLSTDGPSIGGNFTIGEAAARFLRAKVNLNAERILGAAPAGAYDAVISDVDAIEDLGFALDESANYFDIWDASANSEVIMHLNTFTGSRVFNMIHPNQGGWNGFVTLTETFRLFGTDDESLDARLGAPGDGLDRLAVGYLRGQQNDANGSLTDRANAPLVYEDELLTSLEINNERNGIRVVKYPQRGDDGRPAPTNDFVFMRLSEAVLMRAEAALRGGSGADATADINAIRNRAGAVTIGSASLDDVYSEIRRELNSETNIAGHRAVQIRFGTYTNAWEVKTAQDDFRVLFPIPQQALGSNPNLVQNPGY